MKALLKEIDDNGNIIIQLLGPPGTPDSHTYDEYEKAANFPEINIMKISPRRFDQLGIEIVGYVQQDSDEEEEKYVFAEDDIHFSIEDNCYYKWVCGTKYTWDRRGGEWVTEAKNNIPLIKNGTGEQYRMLAVIYYNMINGIPTPDSYIEKFMRLAKKS